MRHKSIQNKLLLYIDGDLSENEHRTVDRHLNRCAGCRKRLEVLSKIWTQSRVPIETTPSPYLYTRIQARIEEYNRKKPVVRFAEGMLERLVYPSFATIGIAITFWLGVLLIPAPEYAAGQPADIKQEFGLEHFDVVPPGSIGDAVLFTLNDNNNEQIK